MLVKLSELLQILKQNSSFSNILPHPPNIHIIPFHTKNNFISDNVYKNHLMTLFTLTILIKTIIQTHKQTLLLQE